MKKSKMFMLFMVMVLAVSAFAGCSSPSAAPAEAPAPTPSETPALSGTVEVDGSSTVFPISEAMAEEFSIENPNVRVTVGVSGTGGGFKRFTVGETDISNASRHIKGEEIDAAKANGIEYTEISLAIDGLTVVINPANDWAAELTVEQLTQIWKNGGAMKWSDVDPSWPAETIKLYSPGTDSGTFDYFVEEIIGKDNEIRTDFTASEDDNVLVQGVAGDTYAIGYFGYSYYEENQDKLKAVAVNGVLPTDATIADGSYTPLSRPIFIYVNHKSYAEKPQVKAFVEYSLMNAVEIVPSTGYIPLSAAQYAEELNKLK
jgi:phosphate transport system substrate-binding protein